jgi:hypothetical protein
MPHPAFRPRYVQGKNYDVQLNTKHKHHLTWAKFLRAFESAGTRGVAEEDLRNICQADGNAGYFRYCLKRGWIRETR